MKSAPLLPIFDALSDPRVVSQIAAATPSVRIGPMITPRPPSDIPSPDELAEVVATVAELRGVLRAEPYSSG